MFNLFKRKPIFSFIPGVHKSYNTQSDWLTMKAITPIDRSKLHGIIGIEEDFDFPIIHQFGPYCTGAAARYLQIYWQYKETGKITDLSALYSYKMNKTLDGLPPGTEGSTMKASADVLRIFGICREILFPTTQANYDSGVLSETIHKDAYTNRIESYTRNNLLDEILASLNARKPVLFGMLLTESFLRTSDGVVPKEVSGNLMGGHAMLAVNADMERELVKAPQSWGRGHPTKNGYMYIPFSWFETVIDNLFPLLMDSYTCLDYVPEAYQQLPQTITVMQQAVRVEVNGQEVKGYRIPPFLAKELEATMLHVRTFEIVFAAILNRPVEVAWDQDTYTVKINV